VVSDKEVNDYPDQLVGQHAEQKSHHENDPPSFHSAIPAILRKQPKPNIQELRLAAFPLKGARYIYICESTQKGADEKSHLH
jgi:hypothetical protein